jgi:hypothetical protein
MEQAENPEKSRQKQNRSGAMKKRKSGMVEKTLPERHNFLNMLAINPNYFGNIPGSDIKPVAKLVKEQTYEQLTCVGYNPDTGKMDATFIVKQSTGYSGSLCHAGSIEYVRFYIDFHDGAGFRDQGMAGINVHDIPARNDCAGKPIFPIAYVAELPRKTFKHSVCSTPAMPRLRAILSWNVKPPEDKPDWNPVWGDMMECDIQLKPSFKLEKIATVDFSKFLELASVMPDMPVKQLEEISGIEIAELVPQPEPPPFAVITENYGRLKVPATRFAFKPAINMIHNPGTKMTELNLKILQDLKIDISGLIKEISVIVPPDNTKANVDYEELACVGLDYNTESLVATIVIKRKAGYSGNLCSAGSKEYVAFWVDWGDECKWQYVNTVQLDAHDLDMPGTHLCYTVTLPLDATFHRKACQSPNVIRVRGVLSWNIPPSTTDPAKLEYYGNRVDTHVQVRPGIGLEPGEIIPLFVVIGGIDVDHVDDATGRTKPGSIFAFNAQPVPANAPFGGTIVINGPSFPGNRYRIKVTNLSTGTSSYLGNALSTVGWSPGPPYAPWTTQVPDINGYYKYLPATQNILNVLARFKPGTENRFLVEIEIEGLFGSFGKVIQMDNTPPKVAMKIDDEDDCTHYKRGDTITGHYYVQDTNIWTWDFGSTYGGSTSGTSNTPPLPGTPFSIPTTAGSYPCGRFSLRAIDKTIIDSQRVGYEVWTSYNVCLK